MNKILGRLSAICFILSLICLYLLFSTSCSIYVLNVYQIPPDQMKRANLSKTEELPPQESSGVIGDLSKAPNRNFTDVRNYGNLLYIAVDTQTPKVISTSGAISAQVTPIP